MVSVMLLAAVVAATALGVLMAYAVCRTMFGLMAGKRTVMVGRVVAANQEARG